MYEDVLMRIALLDICVDEARALEADAEVSSPDPRAIRAIDRAIRRAKCKKLVYRTLPTVARAAAWLTLTIFLMLTVALAFHAGARTRFLSMMKDVTPLRAGANLDPTSAQSRRRAGRLDGEILPVVHPGGLDV